MGHMGPAAPSPPASWRRLAYCLLLPSLAAATGGLDRWKGLQGANYVPSYSKHDIQDIFRSTTWNASVVDRELGYASTIAVTSLRVFVAFGGWRYDPKPEVFMENYKTFQHIAKKHGLSLMVTITAHPPCDVATQWTQTVVDAEVPGVVIAYEAGNEPAPWRMGWVKNCSLPALLKANRNPDVLVGVGYAHYREVLDTAHMVTSINWHSYTGVGNGADLQREIDELQRVANKSNPPKPLLLTEWFARPSQPLAAVYPVIRDNNVAAYAWALIIVNSTSRWHLPVAKGDPPFQGLLWPNGTAYDDLEEGECMRSGCRTVKYVHHCCNRASADNGLFAFGPGWESIDFGHPVYRRPGGPREGSMRQASSPRASMTIGPLPAGTTRVGLYMPISPWGTEYAVSLGGREIHRGTTVGKLQWEARSVVELPAGARGNLTLVVGAGAHAGAKFNISGATFFSAAGEAPAPAQVLV